MTCNRNNGARMLRAAGFAAALLALLLSGLSPAQAESAYQQWFQPSEKNLETWLIRERVGDPYQIDLTRRDGKRIGRATKRVLVIFPRPSSAYDVAMNKILELFAEKDFDAEIKVINFRPPANSVS